MISPSTCEISFEFGFMNEHPASLDIIFCPKQNLRGTFKVEI